jgi:probable DNA repair protein
MERSTDIEAVLQALEDGVTLVTGNARLARRFLGLEAERRRDAGATVWHRGDVLPWLAWLSRLHTDALASGVIGRNEPAIVLSQSQAEALFEAVITTDLPRDTLMQPAAAARQAMRAHELCLAWQLDRETFEKAEPYGDPRTFLRWWQTFDERLAKAGWMAPAALPDHAAAWLARDRRLQPKTLWLAGFEEYTPQQQAFITALEEAGVEVHELAFASQPQGTVVQTPCTDPESEIVAAAHWARAKLEADPRTKVGIVVRDLAEQRTTLARHLEAVLEPPATRDPARRPERPFNISLGEALDDEPLVADALLLLTASNGVLDFGEASRVLRSPFLAGAETERGPRTRAEVLLRDTGEPRVRTDRLIYIARGESDDRHTAPCPALADRLHSLMEESRHAATRQSPAAWAEHFATLLSKAGWPGERSLDSHEYQALGAWQDLLQSLAALGTVLPAINRGRALGQLRRLAGETVFQPHAPPAPVQVLGLFEAIGQQFDATWILGLHDEVWPESPRPNPFIPIHLQRERELPHATAEREHQFAEQLTMHLLASSPEVVVSWPQRTEDRILRPSPLIAELPERDPAAPAVPDPRVAMLESVDMETVEETHGPRLEETQELRGGTQRFADQSNCPFRSFAIHQLGAKQLESPSPGLDPRVRGELVHNILEHLWRRFECRANLATLSQARRDELVRDVVAAEIQHAKTDHPGLFPERFTAIETRRLEAVLDEWLDIELQRPDFTVVEREHKLGLAVGALTIRAKIDRIDRLPDGELVVIDYKTGLENPVQWLGERPEKPQLPVYAAAFSDELAGLLVGQVRSYQCAWVGVVDEAIEIPGAKTAGEWKAGSYLEWDVLRDQWQTTVERLAGEMIEGYAVVDPLPRACNYCHLASLCRVDEMNADTGRDRIAAREAGDE